MQICATLVYYPHLIQIIIILRPTPIGRRHQFKTASVLKRNKDSLLWSRYERCYHLSSLRTLDGYQLYTRALLMLQRFITHINYLSFRRKINWTNLECYLYYLYYLVLQYQFVRKIRIYYRPNENIFLNIPFVHFVEISL